MPPSARTEATDVADFVACALGLIAVNFSGFARSDNFIIIKSLTNFDFIKMGG
jgi:hypothetical protein